MVTPAQHDGDEQSAEGVTPWRSPGLYVALAVLSPFAGAFCNETAISLGHRNPLYPTLSFLAMVLMIAAPVAAIACAIWLAVQRSKATAKSRADHPSTQPIGHTTDGQPIYPIVGYTPDGQPVTADRAVGVKPVGAGTNTMAILSLIAAWNFFPLGIIFGHVALSQLTSTGQSGRGLAIAGLTLGYFSLAAAALIAIAIFGASSQL